MAKVRGTDKTFCLSAIARKLDPKNWHQYMKKVRECGKELIQKNELVCTQEGKIVDPHKAKGPIRFGLATFQRSSI
tara:strand:- start:19 stop:246 length:228 start_codon:yes stop_codon:yes gene_type:complete